MGEKHPAVNIPKWFEVWFFTYMFRDISSSIFYGHLFVTRVIAWRSHCHGYHMGVKAERARAAKAQGESE